MTIIEALRDPNLFKPWFPDEASWAAWVVFLKALFGAPPGEGRDGHVQASNGQGEGADAAGK